MTKEERIQQLKGDLIELFSQSAASEIKDIFWHLLSIVHDDISHDIDNHEDVYHRND